MPADRRDRAVAWCDYLAPVFDVDLPPQAEISDAVGLKTYNFGGILVGTIDAPAQRLKRTARIIARQGIDHLLIQFYRAGEMRIDGVRQPGTVSQRSVAVFDLTQPVVTEASATSAMNLILPRKVLEDQVGAIEDLHGRSFDYGADPAMQLCFTYLSHLAASADQVETHYLRNLSQAAASLCGACFRPATGGLRATEQVTTIAVRQFIEREMTSDTLGVEAIVARFGISRATLYRLFDADGGVAAYIRERRLLLAMRMLTQGGAAGRPRVSAVAYATGFSDEKTFSRAFKRRFNALPREAETGATAQVASNENTPILLSWMKNLSA